MFSFIDVPDTTDATQLSGSHYDTQIVTIELKILKEEQ